MVLTHIRQHRVLAALGALVLLLLTTVTGVILFSEPLARWLIETRAGAATGRSVTIDGALVVDWHWRYTGVHAKHIRLGNASGYREPDMFSVESLGFTFKPYQLLLGKIELGSVVLDKPIIVLERKSAAEANWDFPFSSTPANTAPALQFTDGITIKQGRIIYRNAVRQLQLDVKLDSIDKTAVNSAAPNYEFTVTGRGKLQHRRITFNALGGSLESLRDPAADFPLHLSLVMANTRMDITGVFNDPFRFNGVNANLKIVGDNLADLFYLTAIPLPPTPPYRLNGQLTKDENLWGYHQFTGVVGESDLAGSLSYDLSGPRGFLKADLFSSVLNGADLGGFIGLPPSLNTKKITAAQKQAAVEKAVTTKLIPDVPLNVNRLRRTDLDVTLTAKEINAANVPFKGMEVRFYLKDGQLTLEPFRVVLADGTVDGRIHIDARPDIPPMTLQLNLHRLSLGKFFENTRFARTTQGYFGGNLALGGTGVSLADVLGNSNGKMTILMSDGQISLLLIEASDVDIGEAIPLLLGKDKSTRIRCGLADFTISDGMLNSRTFVLDTEDSLLTGTVGINLQREKIDARLDAKPKDNSLLSARVPITLSGNLGSPDVGLDAKKTGARTAAAIALGTLLTPFAAMLAFVEDGDAKDADCRQLMLKAKQ